MQTFLPYASYQRSASVLDYQRLGKQRVEAYQILLQLCGVRMVDYPQWQPRLGGWSHPAMAMWSGHEVNLVQYIKAMCDEWTSRGYRDTCLDKSTFTLELVRQEDWTIAPPNWVGNEHVHMTHRSNLLRKDQQFYGDVFPQETPDYEYEWPITECDMGERKLSNYLIAKSVFTSNGHDDTEC